MLRGPAWRSPQSTYAKGTAARTAMVRSTQGLPRSMTRKVGDRPPERRRRLTEPAPGDTYVVIQYMEQPVLDREWKKGSADLLVLSLVEHEPRHGYDLCKPVSYTHLRAHET